MVSGIRVHIAMDAYVLHVLLHGAAFVLKMAQTALILRRYNYFSRAAYYNYKLAQITIDSQLPRTHYSSYCDIISVPSPDNNTMIHLMIVPPASSASSHSPPDSLSCSWSSPPAASATVTSQTRPSSSRSVPPTAACPGLPSPAGTWDMGDSHWCTHDFNSKQS